MTTSQAFCFLVFALVLNSQLFFFYTFCMWLENIDNMIFALSFVLLCLLKQAVTM